MNSYVKQSILSSRRERTSKHGLLRKAGLASLLTVSQLSSGANAMMACPESFLETQPNGKAVQLQVHGDDYDSWMTDMDGYTVLRDRDSGSFVYAKPDGRGGLEGSNQLVSMDHNGRHLNERHLRPAKRDCTGMICGDHPLHSKRPSDRRLRGTKILEHSRTIVDEFIASSKDGFNQTKTNTTTSGPHHGRNLGSTGTLRNLVVLIQWSDHVNRSLPTREEIDLLMNHEGPHTVCPTGSVRDVFLENSYGALDLDSTITDWIPINNTEQYFGNAASGKTTRIRDGIRYALDFLDKNHLVDFDYFDADQDGMIDSITFLHSGYGAEFGGTDQYGTFYEDRIWSHKWGLYDEPFVSQSGVEVLVYHISPSLWHRKGQAIGRIGVIAHETGHFLGVPDLYDIDGGGIGVGTYDLMANSWGFDGSQYYPPHMSAWTKLLLGWMIPYFPSEGVNRISASEIQDADRPRVFVIMEGFPTGEFLLIENRQKLGFDSIMPQSGIIISHIDHSTSTKAFYDSLQREGHPGQPDWPQNGNHYGVAIVQADGYFELEQFLNFGDSGDFFHGAGVDSLVPCRYAEACQQPNTDSYQGGIVFRTNVHITDISESGDEMTFHYRVGEFLTKAPTPAPSEPTPPPSKCMDSGRRCLAHDNCCSGFCIDREKRFLGVCY